MVPYLDKKFQPEVFKRLTLEVILSELYKDPWMVIDSDNLEEYKNIYPRKIEVTAVITVEDIEHLINSLKPSVLSIKTV